MVLEPNDRYNNAEHKTDEIGGLSGDGISIFISDLEF